MAVVLSTIIGCASASGPDGASDLPKPGSFYILRTYHLDTLGQPGLAIDDSLRTVAAPNPLQPLNPNSLAFANRRQTTYYRYFANGDVALFLPSFTIAGVQVPDRELLMPFGTKRDRSEVLFDSTIVSSGGASSRYMFQVTYEFKGPSAVTIGSEVVGTMTMLVRQEASVAVTPSGGSTRTTKDISQQTIAYAPRLGFPVLTSTTTMRMDGSNQTVLSNTGSQVTSYSLVK